jgi:F-type H+-transporting ATPase subunit b
MKYLFELNTDLFETNILNLRVVIGVVVTVIGDVVKIILDDRKTIIIAKLEEADQAAREMETKLAESRENLILAKRKVQEILIQAEKTIERETSILQKQLDADLDSLTVKFCQSVYLEQRRIVKFISQQIIQVSLQNASSKLKKLLSISKSIELNEGYIRDNFLTLYSNKQ